MAKSQRFKVETVIKAIDQARGFVTHAADILGCSYQTIYDYAAKYPEVKKAIEDARNKLNDKVEFALYDEAIEKRNTAALIFISKTQLRQRGYNERVDINMSGSISVSWEGLFNGDNAGNESAEETSASDSE